MKFIDIVKEYISDNKILFYSYLILCCISYIIKVLVTSFVYSKLFDKKSHIPTVIRNICFVWVSLCVICAIKIRLETSICSTFLCFIRHKIFSFYLKVNEYNFNDSSISTDVAKLLEVTKNIRDLFFWLVHTLFPMFLLIAVINVYFLLKYPVVGALNIIGNFILIYMCFTKAPQVIKSSIEKENQYLKITDKIDENFNNMMNIYLNNKIDYTLEQNKLIDIEYKNLYIKQASDIEDFVMSLKTITYTTSLLSLITLYKTTNVQGFVRALLVYTFYIGMFENMSEDIPYYIITYGNIKNTEDFYSQKYIAQPVYTNKLTNFKGNIDFVNVSFSYKKLCEENGEKDKTEKKVIDKFSLSVKSGEKITILAKSGSGKSTLMKLLLAFYKPQEGQILLDGKNLYDFPPSQIREQINYVNQRTLLFQDTVLNNMKYGNTRKDNYIISILKKYNLMSVFSKLPNGLDTEVQKNGTNISMGMQKIIFIVRGLLKQDQVVLILDEPLTSIDPNTRQDVLKFISDESQNKTLIVISHDKEVSTIPGMKMFYLGNNGSEN